MHGKLRGGGFTSLLSRAIIIIVHALASSTPHACAARITDSGEIQECGITSGMLSIVSEREPTHL